MKTTYSENNSVNRYWLAPMSGGWWLSLEDYAKLEEAGWVREDWGSDYVRSGNRPYQMHRTGLSFRDSVNEWERITGANAAEQGCIWCGAPHQFSFKDDNGKYEYLDVETSSTINW